MQLNDKQYEQLANWLDADEANKPDISDDLRMVAGEILADQAAMGNTLDVAAPVAAADRARSRMMAELARPQRRVRWITRAAGVAAVVAIIAVASFMLPLTRTMPKDTPPLVELSAETIGQTMAQATEADVVDLLADELADIQTSDYALLDTTLEIQLDAVDDALLDSAIIDDVATWLLDEDGLPS